MIYFEIPGVGKLIFQMLPLISCHVRANSWKYFANYNDKNLVLFVGKKDIYLLPSPTIEIYNLDLGMVSF